MELYTVQLAKWRLVKAKGIPLVDITLRSGNRCFAPTPKLLGDYKAGRITAEEYRSEYYRLMRTSYRVNAAQWDKLLRQPKVAIACYCKAGAFCHRLLLKEMIEKACAAEGIPFSYKGEIED